MTTKLKYTGPAGQHNADVGRETGESAILVPGKTYEVTAELAARLLASSEHFERPKAKPKTTAKPKTSSGSPTTPPSSSTSSTPATPDDDGGEDA